MAKKYISKKQKYKISKSKLCKKSLKSKRIKSISTKKASDIITISKKNNNMKIDPIFPVIFSAQSNPKIQCCFCFKIISNLIKIILEPLPPKSLIQPKMLPFEVACISCFISKLSKNSFKEILSNNFFKENNPHKYTHYRIIGKMSEPLFTADWKFSDELKLLGAIEKLGLGNWEEVSNLIGKGKFECESHYNTFYYKSKTNYLPNEKINMQSSINKKNDILKKNKIEENQLLSKIKSNLGYIPFTIDLNQSNRTVINAKNNKNDSQGKNKIVLQNACNTLGFCEKRKEFDIEYKNDAEIEVMDIEFKENDKKELINMYNSILQNYNNILDERDERKNFVLSKNLFDVKKQLIFEKKLSREDREIYQSMKEYLKYLTNEQFNELFEGMVLEKNLKSRLNQLIYYNKLGINSNEQIHGYINKLKKNNKMNGKSGNKENNKGNGVSFSIKLRESTVNMSNKLKNDGVFES